MIMIMIMIMMMIILIIIVIIVLVVVVEVVIAIVVSSSYTSNDSNNNNNSNNNGNNGDFISKILIYVFWSAAEVFHMILVIHISISDSLTSAFHFQAFSFLSNRWTINAPPMALSRRAIHGSCTVDLRWFCVVAVVHTLSYNCISALILW